MEDITYLVIVAVVSVVATIAVSQKKGIKRIYKYLPSLAVLIGSIIYCVIITITDYNRYIGIVYLVVFITTMPAILLSLITALIFDITRFFIKKIRN